MLGTGREFRDLFSARRMRHAAWSVAHLENWPSAMAGGLWRKPVGQIRFRNGLRFNVDSQRGELGSLYEVFSDRVYDRQFHDIVPEGTILDVGGNIGTFTVRAARDLVPRGTVIVIEPNPKCLLGIEENLKLNRLGNVRVIQGAVAACRGDAALHIYGNTSVGSTLFSAKTMATVETIRVPTLSGRDVLRLANAYELVKVDCEGGEFALLYETVAEDWKGVKRLALEYHIGYDQRYPMNAEQLLRRIEELGFEILFASRASDLGYIAATRA